MNNRRKDKLLGKLISNVEDELEKQREVWEEHGYNKRELYHIIHRELVRVYGMHIREQEWNNKYQKPKGGKI